MTDKAKLSRQRAQGAEAQALIENELISGFFDKAEAEAMSAWKNSKVDEKELREDAWRMFQAVQRLRSCFRSTIAGGKFAAAELLRIENEERNA